MQRNLLPRRPVDIAPGPCYFLEAGPEKAVSGGRMSDDIPAGYAEEPGPAPRFDTVPYQPDGGCPPLGLLLTLLLMVAVAVPAGWAGSAVLTLVWNLIAVIGFFEEKLLLLLLLAVYFGLSMLVVLAGTLGVRWGKVRNPTVAGIAGLSGVGVMVATTAYLEYHAVLAANQAIGEADVMAYIAYGLGGIGSMVFAFWVLRTKASAPFCGECRTWKVKRMSRKLDLAPEKLLRAIRTGDIVPLADYDLSRDRGLLVLNVAVCPTCGEAGTVDVQVQEVTTTPKGHKQVKELAHVSYPGEVLRVLDALFEPGAPDPPAPS